MQVIKRRSAVFVVSDFISTPGWDRSLACSRGGTKSSRCGCSIRWSMELPDLGLVVMQDAETGEQLFVDTQDRGFRKRFAERRAARRRSCAPGSREAGVDCLELATDDARSRRCCASPHAQAAQPVGLGSHGNVHAQAQSADARRGLPDLLVAEHAVAAGRVPLAAALYWALARGAGSLGRSTQVSRPVGGSTAWAEPHAPHGAALLWRWG